MSSEKVSRTYRMSPELAERLNELKGDLEGRDLSEFVEAAIWKALAAREQAPVAAQRLLSITPRVGFGPRSPYA